eukprot:6189338-Pleurochrysis_carterae.AAC.2
MVVFKRHRVRKHRQICRHPHWNLLNQEHVGDSGLHDVDGVIIAVCNQHIALACTCGKWTENVRPVRARFEGILLMSGRIAASTRYCICSFSNRSHTCPLHQTRKALDG